MTGFHESLSVNKALDSKAAIPVIHPVRLPHSNWASSSPYTKPSFPESFALTDDQNRGTPDQGVYIYMHIYIFSCVYIYIYAYMHVYMYMHACIYIYIYRCMHIYVYKYPVHTHACV